LTTAEDLEIFRRRRRWFLFWSLGYVPFGSLVVAMAFFVRLPRSVGMVFVTGWLIVAAVAACRAALVRCPQCGKLFHCYRNKRYLAAPFFFLYRQCKQCGFSIPTTP